MVMVLMRTVPSEMGGEARMVAVCCAGWACCLA